MDLEKETLKKMIDMSIKMEDLDQRLDGLLDLLMESLDKVDELNDKVDNALNYFERKRIWREKMWKATDEKR